MEIEVWADVVCPWCYIGKHRMQQALAGLPSDVDVRIVHRAFELDPTAVSRGVKAREHLSEKYGVNADDAQQMMQRVTDVAAEDGLALDMSEAHTGNTRDAHRLILWAQEHGRAQELLEAFYRAYFVDGVNIFDPKELLGIVERIGLDPVAAGEILAGNAFDDQIGVDQGIARQLGATGVPFFVIDGKYGISGAQPREAFTQTFEQALASS
jgi:predicted DsbA family dithiol-disulfide isomerase